MTQPPEGDYPGKTPAPLPTRSTGSLPGSSTASLARPPQRGCVSWIVGAVGWLLTLVLSAALAIGAAAAILYFVFGFNLNTPGQLRQASVDIAALSQENTTLRAEVAQLQTAVVSQAAEDDDARTQIAALETQVAAYAEQAVALADQAATAAALAGELNENIALAATIQAEGRENQVLVAVVATVQAENTTRLTDLQRRTDRIARFLQRLGNLAEDAALDSDGDLLTPTPSADPTETPEPEPTATP
jgi:septal ring factor EnvC (AmiA/AmiB activator)